MFSFWLERTLFGGQIDDHPVKLAGEAEVVLHLVIVRDRRAVIHAEIEGLAEREGAKTT